MRSERAKPGNAEGAKPGSAKRGVALSKMARTTGQPVAAAAPVRSRGLRRREALQALERDTELEARLGHHFARPELLRRALTHRSVVFDGGPGVATLDRADSSDPAHDNERLEFLGDAVVGLLVAEALCERFTGLREGDLTRMRAALVSRRHLGAVGGRLELGRFLLLGETAERNAGRTNAGLFANAVEALLAALYLDGGLEVARQFVARHVLDEATVASLDGDPASAEDGVPGLRASGLLQAPGLRALNDWKTALQEQVQAGGLGRPQYSLLAESGPDHRRLFRVEVRLLGANGLSDPLGAAESTTKKSAQQEAARLALMRLNEDESREGTLPGAGR